MSLWTSTKSFLRAPKLNGQGALPNFLCGIISWSVAIQELKLGKPKAKLNPRKRENKRGIWGTGGASLWPVPTLKFFWKKITYYMYIKRGRFNTPLSEKTKMSACFWVYDAKKRKARKKCHLGESLNWIWIRIRKTVEDLLLKYKTYNSCGSHSHTWSTLYKFWI